MSTLSDKLLLWATRVRRAAYVFGLIGVLVMLTARGMDEPARSLWAQRAFIFLGLMFAGFLTYYMLTILRMYRR